MGPGTPAPCAWMRAATVDCRAAGSFVACTASMVFDTVRLAKTEPITATPSAAPTCRTVEFVPLATPDFSSGMSDRITLVSCELAKPMPKPNSPQPRSRSRNVTDGLTTNAMTTRPITSSTSPSCTTRVTPTWRTRRPPIWDPTMMNTPAGTIHSPLVSAERCLASCR